MSYVIAILVFGLCFLGMASGLLLARKVLRKGCSADPTDPNASCACRQQDERAQLDNSDSLLNIQPGLKTRRRL